MGSIIVYEGGFFCDLVGFWCEEGIKPATLIVLLVVFFIFIWALNKFVK